jgi:hypothetical protein
MQNAVIVQTQQLWFLGQLTINILLKYRINSLPTSFNVSITILFSSHIHPLPTS